MSVVYNLNDPNSPGTAAYPTGSDCAPSSSSILSPVFSISQNSSIPYSILEKMTENVGELVLVKGAPEAVLSCCNFYLPPSAGNLNDAMELNENFLKTATDQANRMASEGLRVLALAYKALPPQEESLLLQEKIESHLVFLGLIDLIDPPRSGVKESVAVCHNAGIRVIMITGDHLVTAVSIAKNLGIVDPQFPSLVGAIVFFDSHPPSFQCCAIKGSELDILDDEALSLLNPFPVVFARVRFFILFLVNSFINFLLI